MDAEKTLRNRCEDYYRVEKAIDFLSENFKRQPSLDEIAAAVHLSKHHFHRLFKSWAGVTPTQFLHALTVEYARNRLLASRSIFDASLEAGLSGGSRLHDLFVAFEAMTPGTYKRGGKGLTITYGCHCTPFGRCLIAATPRGICALRFLPSGAGAGGEALQALQAEWPRAVFTERRDITGPMVRRIFSTRGDKKPFLLALKGTNFQIQVWRALLAIPAGALVSYGDIAAFLGNPQAVRAVAGAVAANPVAYLIPCHRVISKTGLPSGYRWGESRKKIILGCEAFPPVIS